MSELTVNNMVFISRVEGTIDFECPYCEEKLSIDVTEQTTKNDSVYCGSCDNSISITQAFELFDAQFPNREDVIYGKDDEVSNYKADLENGDITEKKYDKKTKDLYLNQPRRELYSSCDFSVTSGIRFKRDVLTITLHYNGRIQVTGVISEAEAQRFVDRLVEQLGWVQVEGLEVSNINAMYDMNRNIDLIRFYSGFRLISELETEYEPEIFPPVRVSYENEDNISFQAQFFGNGKVVINTENYSVIQDFCEMLEDSPVVEEFAIGI